MIKRTKSHKKQMGAVKKILILFTVLAVLGGVYIHKLYQRVYDSNVVVLEGEDGYVYIPTGATFSDFVFLLEHSSLLKDLKSFEWVAQKKGLPNRLRAGRYKVANGMSNNALVNLLRSGKQEPVKVTFNNIRFLPELAGVVSKKIEADSTSLMEQFQNTEVMNSFGFNSETFIAMFVPNTYQVYWNTSAEQFVKRMNSEYKRFWNEERLEKAKQIGLTPLEVAIMGSIVDEETVKNDEKPIVAGLYYNRLKKRMKLQADPTVKYALGDFAIKRIWGKDLEIDSPYNTYKHYGLPPGPIRMTSIQGMKAVLNHKKHNYLYMCAKEDFSGYHNFATSLLQHNRNARKYQKALRQLGIRR